MEKFFYKVENNKDYPDILQAANIDAANMAEAVKKVKRELGVKRLAKIYLSEENYFDALLSNKKHAEQFVEIYKMEEEDYNEKN